MPKHCAFHGSCTVLLRNTLLVFTGRSLRDHDASESSPVLRKWLSSTVELLVPWLKFTPSAVVLRMRTERTVTWSAPVVHRPLRVCSTHTFSMTTSFRFEPEKPRSPPAVLSRHAISP